MQQNIQDMPQKFVPNAVGVKQYSTIEFANPTYRQYMEDSMLCLILVSYDAHWLFPAQLPKVNTVRNLRRSRRLRSQQEASWSHI